MQIIINHNIKENNFETNQKKARFASSLKLQSVIKRPFKFLK